MKVQTCIRCKESKPISEFYKRAGGNDRYQTCCKDCTKKRVRDNYRANKEHYRRYEQKRSNLPHRVKAREEYAQTESGKEAAGRAKEKWRRMNPTKRLASSKVNYAVRAGNLIKPDKCDQCGENNTRIHGHHDDYAKPLNVRWLCPACHTAWHKVNGEAKNARA